MQALAIITLPGTKRIAFGACILEAPLRLGAGPFYCFVTNRKYNPHARRGSRPSASPPPRSMRGFFLSRDERADSAVLFDCTWLREAHWLMVAVLSCDA
jgi:hypothetical protein